MYLGHKRSERETACIFVYHKRVSRLDPKQRSEFSLILCFQRQKKYLSGSLEIILVSFPASLFGWATKFSVRFTEIADNLPLDCLSVFLQQMRGFERLSEVSHTL